MTEEEDGDRIEKIDKGQGYITNNLGLIFILYAFMKFNQINIMIWLTKKEKKQNKVIYLPIVFIFFN